MVHVSSIFAISLCCLPACLGRIHGHPALGTQGLCEEILQDCHAHDYELGTRPSVIFCTVHINRIKRRFGPVANSSSRSLLILLACWKHAASNWWQVGLEFFHQGWFQQQLDKVTGHVIPMTIVSDLTLKAWPSIPPLDLEVISICLLHSSYSSPVITSSMPTKTGNERCNK